MFLNTNSSWFLHRILILMCRRADILMYWCIKNVFSFCPLRVCLVLVLFSLFGIKLMLLVLLLFLQSSCSPSRKVLPYCDGQWTVFCFLDYGITCSYSMWDFSRIWNHCELHHYQSPSHSPCVMYRSAICANMQFHSWNFSCQPWNVFLEWCHEIWLQGDSSLLLSSLLYKLFFPFLLAQ